MLKPLAIIALCAYSGSAAAQSMSLQIDLNQAVTAKTTAAAAGENLAARLADLCNPLCPPVALHVSTSLIPMDEAFQFLEKTRAIALSRLTSGGKRASLMEVAVSFDWRHAAELRDRASLDEGKQTLTGDMQKIAFDNSSPELASAT